MNDPVGSLWESHDIDYNNLLRLPPATAVHLPDFVAEPPFVTLPEPLPQPRPDRRRMHRNRPTDNEIRRILIGRSYAFAQNYLEWIIPPRPYRIISVDNLSFAVTLDFNMLRVNLQLRSNANRPFKSNASQQKAINFVNRNPHTVTVTGVTFG